MELQIFNPTGDGFVKAIEWNNEDIKAEVTAKVQLYTGLVYDEEQIKEAKADRAELNKFKKVLEDKRKEIKQICLAPYESFEKQIKEIVAIIDEPIGIIDGQVKAFEEKQKAEKLEEIKAYFETKDFHGFTFEQIADNKWLNATTSMKSIKEAIDAKAGEIETDIELINALSEYTFEAMETYKKCGDIKAALAEAKRLTDLAKQKAEWEAQKAEREAAAEQAKAEELEAAIIEPEVVEEPAAEPEEDTDNFIPDFDTVVSEREWKGLKVSVTPDQQQALEKFLIENNITYEIY